MPVLFDKSLFVKKWVEPVNRVPVDTLILIGNGFDIWQGYDTSYASFERYYHAHLQEVLKRLHISPRILKSEDGNEILYSDVELFFGNPENPQLLPHDFWSDFETSLDKVDDQGINYYFGRETEGIKSIQKCSNNAQKILRELFCDWIETLDIKEENSGYNFGDNCLFVNFNYTSTMLNQFAVKPENEFHIHGEAADRNSIIFGHATHPEMAYGKLNMGMEHPRYLGLYYIEEALFQLDKHIEDNYMRLKVFLALHGAVIEDIKNIYVLGLSFGDADLAYIRHLIYETQGIDYNPEGYLTDDELMYLEFSDRDILVHLNIQYAAKHRQRILEKEPIPYPEYEIQDAIIESFLDDPYYDYSKDKQMRLEKAAVRRRFEEEQTERNKKITKEYLRMLNKKTGCGRITMEEAFLQAGKDKLDNLSGAKWTISFYSANDRERIENVMKRYGCKDYTLKASIGECLQDFKVRGMPFSL